MDGRLYALAGAALCALLALGVGSEAAADATIGGWTHAPRPVQGEPEALAPRDRHLAYYTVASDPRDCVSPLCGGFWVTRVNRSGTVCADGSLAASCYVSELDLSLLGVSAEQEGDIRGAAGHLLMRGSIEPNPSPPFGNLGMLRGAEAWIGHAGVVATGTFYRARDNGIVCIAFPCLHVEVSALNLPSAPQAIADIDLSAASADTEDGYAQLAEPIGLLTAGELLPVSGPAGISYQLQASEYYLPVTPEFTACQSGNRRSCARGEFCDLGGKAQCGRASEFGVCAVRPQACTLIYDPVCGCDGNTYSSGCAAHGAGVGVDYAGACK